MLGKRLLRTGLPTGCRLSNNYSRHPAGILALLSQRTASYGSRLLVSSLPNRWPVLTDRTCA